VPVLQAIRVRRCGPGRRTKIFEIKIELREVPPAVVRWVQVPGEATLAGLHEVVQVAMGWTDSHLHEFEVDGARYGLPDPDWDAGEVDEARVKLFRLLGQGDRMNYVYDFGDGWTRRLTVEKVLAAEPGVAYPRCVSGRRACPPEDVGGPWGYDGFLEAMADPTHPEHEQYR
jgi:Plasmid pRiA4b ORF-3-like protein